MIYSFFVFLKLSPLILLKIKIYKLFSGFFWLLMNTEEAILFWTVDHRPWCHGWSCNHIHGGLPTQGYGNVSISPKWVVLVRGWQWNQVQRRRRSRDTRSPQYHWTRSNCIYKGRPSRRCFTGTWLKADCRQEDQEDHVLCPLQEDSHKHKCEEEI